VIALGVSNPVEDVRDVVLSPNIILLGIDPVGGTPFQPVKFYVWITLFGLLHEPPFITPLIVLILGRAHMARFRAIGRVHVTANLDFINLKGRSEVGLKKIIENFVPLFFRIVDQKP